MHVFLYIAGVVAGRTGDDAPEGREAEDPER